jgi:alpha-glucosidase
VPLSFLSSGDYKAQLVRDSSADDSVQVENISLTRADNVTINLRAGGGFVGRFAK